MSVFHNNALIGAGGGAAAAAGFQIDRSLRFNSADSAYLNRTPSSAGNRKTYTLSFWVKKSKIDDEMFIFAAKHSGGRDGFRFEPGNTFRVFFDSANGGDLVTSQVFRDPSAWYHFVIAVDTTQSTAANRVKIYVNGTQIEDFSTETYPVQDYTGEVNNNNVHRIGADTTNLSNTLEGYLTEIHFVDGQALAPTDFGGFDVNNVWQPKEYSGTYGTNGFRLTFADNSSDAALGTDTSGNSNTFTVNNLYAGAAVPNKGFDIITYTGNGSTQTIGGLKFQPDFVWVKNRSRAVNHHVVDSVRGAVSSKVLYPNLNIAEGATNSFSAFTSDGFSVGSNSSVNHSGDNLVAWCWKAGGTASSNTDGSITSSVSASPEYGFSVVSFTGDGSGTDTIGHGLNAAPKLVIVKDRDNTNDWLVYTDQVDGSWDYLKLNTNDAKANSSYSAATSSVFSYGTDSTNYIAYCWSEVPGFSKFGVWTGNESSNGPTVTLGFKPRLVIFKRADSSGDNWTIFDTARDSGTLNVGLQANVNNAEESFGNRQIVVSDTGFQVTSTGASSNANGGKYLYAAFADGDGSGIDSLIDTPTNYTADSGNNGGNYATLSAVDNAGVTLSNGNLEVSTSGWQSFKATIGVTSGKWYWETQNKQTAAAILGVATAQASVFPNGSIFGTTGHGGGDSNPAWTWAGANYYFNASSAGTGLSNHSATDIVMYALDLDNGKLWFGRNGTWYSSSWATTGNPSTGANATVSGLNTTYTYFPAGSIVSGGAIYNFGARPFVYTPPTGFVSLCTQNLADPTIADGSTAFDIALYTGNGSTQSILGVNHSPDLVWIKCRSAAKSHSLFDSVRGATKLLKSDVTQEESTQAGGVTSFDSNGFSIGNRAGNNENNATFVAWAWDAGTSTASNTDGNITTNVRASQTNGFSIATYTGNGSANQTLGHGLGAAPAFVIIKDRSSSQNWAVLHTSAGTLGTLDGGTNYKLLELSSTDGARDASYNTIWHPTNTTVKIGEGASSAHWTNKSGDNYVMYAWAPVEGFSSFGSYEGNGSSDGPFIYTGFRPKFILQKRTDTSGSSWNIVDTERSSFNVTDVTLYPDSNSAEGTIDLFDILSNGFKLRTTNGGQNASSGTFIYAAFAEHPLRHARAR